MEYKDVIYHYLQFEKSAKEEADTNLFNFHPKKFSY